MVLRVRACIVAVLTIVTALTAASAASAYVYTGTTTPHRLITLTAGPQGRIVEMKYAWAARCQHRGSSFWQSVRVTFPGAVSTRFFRPLRVRARQGVYTVRGSAWVRGHKVSVGTWAGTLYASVDILRGGHRVDRCRLGTIAWRAVTQVASLSFSGDPGDFITAGHVYHFAAPGVPVSVQAGPSSIQIAMGGWMVWFSAGTGHRFGVRTYTGAQRDPFNGTNPGLSIFGDGRGCNTATGSFTITRLRFGPKATLRRFAVTFVQHCEGAAPALRGSFTFSLG